MNGFRVILFSGFKIIAEGAFRFINLVIPGKEPERKEDKNI
jgi:hypothetical protein